MALWGGRFAASPAETVFQLSRSVHFDWRLAPYDLVSSIAHIDGLERSSIVDSSQAKIIRDALRALLDDVLQGRFTPNPSDEDVHSALERGLIERLGEQGGALRAGRSRNDQVVTDLKLYLLDAISDISTKIVELSEAILRQANDCLDLISPGFTHLQHAQPISFGQELSKHAFALERDLGRIADWRQRTLVSPLGSGALAGSALVPHPEAAAKQLGFKSVVENSIDGVSDRDFVTEALFVLSMVGSHLSRIGEEFTLLASSEFGWVRVDDAYSTGSSIMPQKRNPDVAELARGKAGRMIGNLVTVMTVLKGLPFAYNRDLQEDKEPVFDSIDTLNLLLPAVTGMIATARFDRDRISAGSLQGFALATEIADYLVKKGIPFSEAHETAGKAVRMAENRGVGLEDLSVEEYKGIDSNFGADVLGRLAASSAVSARSSTMGTAPEKVREANGRLAQRLSHHRSEINKNIEELRTVLQR